MGSTRKASLQGHVDLEGTEDGSGGYNDFSATCIRNGHRDEDRPVGPPGIYEVIATDRKVDGILSAHQTKEACVKTRAAWDDRNYTRMTSSEFWV